MEMSTMMRVTKPMDAEYDNAYWENIRDPTSLNARQQLNFLFESLPSSSPLIAELHAALSQDAYLPTLSQFMLRPALTIAIAWAFRPLIMDLCARWLDIEDDVWAQLEALALLIEIHEEIFPILSSFLRRFERGPILAMLSGRTPEEVERALFHRVLLASYRILRATPTLPRNFDWDLACLLKLCANSSLDRGTRWLAIRCYALQTNMSETARLRSEQEALGELYNEDCPYGEEITGTVREIDGWILPVLEDRRIREYRDSLLDPPDYFSGSEESDIIITGKDLSPRIANICGILLLRVPSPRPIPSSLVPTSSAVQTLRRLAVNVSLRRPTLLTSAPSGGKATFIHHIAGILHPTSSNRVITIHLADTSLDPRSLLGSYVSSTTTSGAFEWRDGVLVKAMQEGRWVVLKDIDRASKEVLGLISPLLDSLDDIKPIGSNATLSLGNRGKVEAGPSFALFATRSAEGGEASIFPPLNFLGSHKWWEIVVPESSLDDLRLILHAKFPDTCGPVADSLIDIWLTVKRLRVVSSSRVVGIRDLEKLSSRVTRLLKSNYMPPSSEGQQNGVPPSITSLFPHPSIREEMYLDARDVFFAAGASTKPALEQREAMAAALAEKFGLSEEDREWVLTRRTSAFEIEKDVDGRHVAIRAGHTRLGVDPFNRLTDPAGSRPFSMHKQAVRLFSQITACVASAEPVLLTGETGTGKTAAISHLASLLNKPLVSLNLSNQTETSDLIGGFRPVSTRVPALELQRRFMDLFRRTFSSKRNEQLLRSSQKALANAKWKSAVTLWSETSKTAVAKLRERGSVIDVSQRDETVDAMQSSTPRKRRKTQQSDEFKASVSDWAAFEADVRLFEVQHVLDKSKFAFQYIEGSLVKSIRTGSWVLLDEINLASPETLECIAGLLQGPTSSITLTEKGSLEPVPRHSEFRLFACMNPATDVGKKGLPANIRAGFTEIEVLPPDDDPEALISVISHYIGHLAVADKSVIADIAELYTSLKQLAVSGKIADGSNHRPHFSVRSLSRALTFASDTIQWFGLRRALWEGFTMAFTMVLDENGTNTAMGIARRTLLSNIANKAHFLSKPPRRPHEGQMGSYLQIGPFWLSSGPNERDDASDYILTPSVQKKLVDLARIVTTKRYPVLIEGPTSSGKTSAIHYLARRTGHTFVRINNHEHTDIQEYLGSYVSDTNTGKLVFRDGLLVRALRHGDWMVLDELNLAPTDVLEALNRLLDDNRELVVPETQEVIRPHPNFMLFATQNPPGAYSGRKILSRALRNRFLEVHFEDVPPTELEHILSERSRIPPSYSRRIVAVFQELQKRRQIARIFEGKEGFATLRDLFRWAGRDAQDYQELAENGYMLLAERARRDEDKQVVKDVIETVMNVSISEADLYTTDKLGQIELSSGIVWTQSMRRLFILLSRALIRKEPVLLVGETGTGKTSVCQIFAEVEKKILRIVNCHQNTEAADIIGGLRPNRRDDTSESGVIREAAIVLGCTDGADLASKDQLAKAIVSRLEEGGLNSHQHDTLIRAQRALLPDHGFLSWQDGPLVTSMRSGDVFLLDEISLADDSVLERLNSVLEPTRTLVLAEKGGETTEEFEIVADPGFKFIATMNPGGDFGKKELSPALRNRFTEIWIPSVGKRDELAEIVMQSWKHNELKHLTDLVLNFVEWFVDEVKDNSIVTLRDLLSWVDFCNTLFLLEDLPTPILFVQGGKMSLVDGLHSLPQLSSWTTESIEALHERACLRLAQLCADALAVTDAPSLDISIDDGKLHVRHFSMPIGPQPARLDSFSFRAPTSLENAFRLVRACQISKPVLLEGSPGVGKTSLVAALAAATGKNLCRINLSEQTDLIDLFGSDLPTEGHASGKFSWNDADFLRALKNGDWVLLDEMNLASQSVLEGLNAVFDHRGAVYVPELDRTFTRHPNFRVFAAQNPLNQGSGRKGLPKSFLNRFTKVYIQRLSPDDLLSICRHLFPAIGISSLWQMITFNNRLEEEVNLIRRFGTSGAPWEFNLRDVLRWASLMITPEGIGEPWMHINTVYGSRFRTENDRAALSSLFADVFGDSEITQKMRSRLLRTPELVKCGSSLYEIRSYPVNPESHLLLPAHCNEVEAALSGLSRKWLIIVTGSHSSGKTSFVRGLSSICGCTLEELSLGSSSDTSDLIGSFEQTNEYFNAEYLLRNALDFCDSFAALVSLGNAEITSVVHSLRREIILANRTRNLAALRQLIGTVLQQPLLDILDTEIKSILESVASLPEEGKGTPPGFKWMDGPLIQAMKRGHWLLLDNANLCSPSVLDRLNSLCETNGYIVLTEKRFNQEKIYPHPEFRLIVTVDPCHGEISRAMRNRGVEVNLDVSSSQVDGRRQTPLHGFPRPSFDLPRRKILYALQPRYGCGSPSPVTPCHSKDSFSSLLRKVEVLYSHLHPPSESLMAFFILSISSISSAKALLRLCKSFGSTNLMALLQQPSVELFWPHRLNRLLAQTVAHSDSQVDINRPLHPLFYYPRVDWLPDHERQSWISISLILDLVVQSAGLEMTLHSSSLEIGHRSRYEVQGGVPDEQDAVLSFTEAVPVLVQCVLLKKWDSVKTVPDIEAILDLVHYARHLQEAAVKKVADFSTLFTVSGLIIRCLDLTPNIFEGIADQVRTLQRRYSLTSGQRIIEIWTSLYRPQMPGNASVLLHRLNRLPLAWRKNAVDLIALVTARHDVGGGIVHMLEHTQGEAELPEEEFSIPAIHHMATLARELHELAYFIPLTNKDSSNVGALLHSLEEPHALVLHASRLVAYKILLWKMDIGQGALQFLAAPLRKIDDFLEIVPELVNVHIEWHKSLWSCTEYSKVLEPSVLYTPIFLRSTLAMNATQESLNDISIGDVSLRHQVDQLLSERFQTCGRRSSMFSFLIRNIELVLLACSPNTEDNVFRQMPYDISSIQDLVEFLNHPVYDAFSPLNVALVEMSQSSSWPEHVHALGKTWIRLSQLLMHLFVPSLDVDPVLIQHCREFIQRSRCSWIHSQAQVYSFWEQCTTGLQGNIMTSLLRDGLERMKKNPVAISMSRRISRQSDLSLLQAFWSEARGFLTEMISTDRLDRFIATARGNEFAAGEEALLQDSICNFLQRMKGSYGDLYDLIQPVELALMQLRFGLRTLRHAAVVNLAPSVGPYMREIIMFPSIRAKNAVSISNPEDLVCLGVPSNVALLLQLLAIQPFQGRKTERQQNLRKIRQIYERIMASWDADLIKKAEAARQSETLYRIKHNPYNTDAELSEDEEVQLLFPTFSDDDSEKLSERIHEQKPLSTQTLVLSREFSKKLVEMHLSLFCDECRKSWKRNGQYWRELRVQLVSSWIDGPVLFVPCDADDDSFGFRLDILHDSALRRQHADRSGPYSFYRSANLPEARKAEDVVRLLRSTLNKLILRWPDQIVLRHLRDRCDNVLSMSLYSPIAKLLGAMERLLLHTEDWEQYANHENSLLVERQALIVLILAWRKLELDGWKSILDWEADAFCNDLWDWWFKLYDIAVRGAEAANRDPASGAFDAYLDTMVPLVEDFIASAPMGQFEFRLELISSFARLTAELGSIEERCMAMVRVSHILTTIHSFYRQFSGEVVASLTNQRASIEGEIQGLVKLASWRDVNVHALQQSAQRTHKQLYRRIRKFRELLREPVNLQLQPRGHTLDQVFFSGRDDAISNVLDNLDTRGRTLEVAKFTAVLSDVLSNVLNPLSAAAAEELASTITTLQDELAMSVPPQGLPLGERKRWSSALLSRKRRAWYDFLKELKRIGLSPNVKPDILRRHRNLRSVMEQPPIVIPKMTPVSNQFRKIDDYFHRSIVLLRGLLQHEANHHEDIGTPELHRGISSFESAFSLATSARARLSDISEKYNNIVVFRHKLHGLRSSQRRIVGVGAAEIVLQELEKKTTDVTEALDELVELPSRIANLSGDSSSINSKVLSSIRDWIARATNIATDLSGLSKALRVSQIITEDDCDLVRASVYHLESINLLLEDVSERQPDLQHFCRSIRDWYKQSPVKGDALLRDLENREQRSIPSIDVSVVTNILLVIGQELAMSKEPSSAGTDDQSNHIFHQDTSFSQICRTLRIDSVTSRLRQLSVEFAGGPSALISEALNHLLPFLDTYISFVGQFLFRYSAWTKSLLKLTYICGSLLCNIAKNGFCKPLETEEAGDNGGGDIEAAGGTGLGHGEGNEDVSGKIEDERQFEGIKGQEDDVSGQRNEYHDNEGIDVDFDLSGDLEDGPEQDSMSEGEQDDVRDLDDEFGQIDTDELKPDEDFWNKPLEDSGIQDLNGSKTKVREAEMVAKQEGEPGDMKENQGQDASEVAKDNPMSIDIEQEEAGLDQEQGSGADIGDVADADSIDGSSYKAQSEDGVADADDLDLVDDAEGTERGSGLNQLEHVEEDKGMVESGEPEDEEMHEGSIDQKEDLNELREKIRAGDEPGGAAHSDQRDAPSQAGTSRDSTETSLDLLTSGVKYDRPTPAGASGAVASWANAQISAQTDPSSGRIEMGGQQSKEVQREPLPNPLRNLGDALREVKRRFEEIMEAPGTEARSFALEDDTTDQAALEYSLEETQDTDMQALGPALGEETVKLSELSLVEENNELHVAPVEAMPSIEEEITERHDTSTRDQRDASTQEDGSEPRMQEKQSESDAMDVDNDRSDLGELLERRQVLSQIETIEIELNKWLRDGQPEEDAQRIWQLYDVLTQPLSFSLCEQLRLILEPTRATRLMGDFRTGKRLNMKKIIPYIASKYTKDKIWLRRVRPSQREYQILIALDDSRSMAESHSIHLAFQTLGLVSKALNRLEVGEVAIASFGEKMQMVHSFEDGPFTDQAGIKILESFKFAQTATDVRSLLESSVEVLTKVREHRGSSSSSDLWQLEIIISDGICQDHEELHAIMRKAEEEHILVVFIVIDAIGEGVAGESTENSSRAQNSIVNMTQATYRTINGRLELHMQRYLDSFPFEFFVILKNVETLPDILADTLRQFFERISSS